MTAVIVAGVSALLLTGALLPVLRAAQFWDVPNDRSSHAVPTPRGGGLAVMVATMVALPFSEGRTPWVVVAVAGILALVGLVDDLRTLSARTRLVAQVLAACALVTWVVTTQGHPIWPGAFAVVAGVGVVAYVNAFNFMDGVNGISGFNAILAGGWFAWLGETYTHSALTVAGAALAGATAGFLPWNLAGRVFLGDVGSYGIGALVAALAVLAWGLGVPGPLAVAPLLVYLADTAWALVKRRRRGERLSVAHREHVYQRLVDDSHWSHPGVSLWSVMAALACCSVLAATRSSSLVLGVAAAAAITVLYLMSPWLTRRLS